jgi:S1-C subfamily serine protease
MAYCSRLVVFIVFTALPTFVTQSFSSAEDDPGPAIYASEAPGVVRIRATGVKSDGMTGGEDGSGFVISPDGYVLTASHVVLDDDLYSQIEIGGNLGPETGDGAQFGLKLLKRDDDHDIALLKFDAPPPNLTVLPIRKGPAKAGEAVFVLGYPLGLPQTHFLDGRIEAVDGDVLTTNALVDKGNSGGPVMDRKGCVLGVVFGGVTSNEGGPVNGLKFAVPIQALADFIPADAIGSPPSEMKQEGDVIHVTDALQRTQEDHGLSDTVKSYQDVIKARDGFKIESVEGVGKVSYNPPGSPFPEAKIAADGMSMSFNYSLRSGPFYDQRRGWIDMSVSTRQRRIGAAGEAVDGTCG